MSVVVRSNDILNIIELWDIWTKINKDKYCELWYEISVVRSGQAEVREAEPGWEETEYNQQLDGGD